MEFLITTASGDGNGRFGNTKRIKELNNTKIQIRTLDDLKKFSAEVDAELMINFKEMTIMIYDYYLGVSK